jgi:hypothetical protein
VRTSGIRQTQELGGLIERLTRRVIPRFAEKLLTTDALRLNEHRVPARDQERNVRERRRLRFKEGGEQMALEMMDANGWNTPGIRKAPGQSGAGEKRPDEPRPGRISHPLKIGRRAARSLKRAANERQKALNVIPRGQFRDYPAKDPMQLDLAEQLMRQETPLTIEHRHSTFITG